MENNPYSSPSANLFGEAGSTLTSGPGGVAESTLRLLQQTKPWARFVGVMVIIYGSLVAVVGLSMGGLTFVGGGFAAGSGAESTAFRAGFGFGVMFLYGLIGFCFIYPGWKLNLYASGIGQVIREPTVARLDAALVQQRGMWKFAGIMIIIGLAIFLLAIVSAVMIPLLTR